jgi:hypothetical protein
MLWAASECARFSRARIEKPSDLIGERIGVPEPNDSSGLDTGYFGRALRPTGRKRDLLHWQENQAKSKVGSAVANQNRPISQNLASDVARRRDRRPAFSRLRQADMPVMALS